MAICRAIFGYGLIKHHDGAAAAGTKEDNLFDPRLLSQVANAAANIEGNVLPIHSRFVVRKAHVHAENHKATA